jgi:hypothetical protein
VQSGGFASFSYYQYKSEEWSTWDPDTAADWCYWLLAGAAGGSAVLVLVLLWS